MEIELGNGGGRSKSLGAVAVGLGVLLLLVDFIVLKGEVVGRDTALLNGTSPAIFQVTRVEEPHLVEIRTKRRVGGEYRGRKVAWQLVDPLGVTVRRDEELMDHKERHFRFEPMLAGEYRLFIEDNGLLLKTETASAQVVVTVNDRRITKRFGFSL